jgi:predicted transcriptional regulator
LSKDDVLPFELFADLASETRCAILVALNDEPLRLNQLAKKLDLTIQDAHRNADKLAESGIIRKNPDSTLSLTGYGRLMTKQITSLQFLSKHKQYFEDHTLENMPEKFVQRIGALNETRLITSVAEILEKLKKIESGTKNHLKIIVSQAWSDEGKILINLIKNNVTVHSLIGKNTVFPDEIIDEIIEKHLNKLASRENMERRQIEKIDVALYIGDEACAVMFPNKNGTIEMNTMFLGNGETFREWCDDIYEYYWSRSRPQTKIARKDND